MNLFPFSRFLATADAASLAKKNVSRRWRDEEEKLVTNKKKKREREKEKIEWVNVFFHPSSSYFSSPAVYIFKSKRRIKRVRGMRENVLSVFSFLIFVVQTT